MSVPQPLPPNWTWTETGGITDTQSFTWVIVNAIYDRLAASEFFTGFTIRRINRALPIEAGIQIPFLGIYQGDEGLGPDGDSNVADIRFAVTIPMGFQIIVKNNDPVAMLRILDQCSWFIMNRLLRDNSLTNLLDSNLPDNTKFEAVPRGRIRDRWGTTGQRNETPVGERLLELTFLHRIQFAPDDMVPLERITVTTGFPAGGTEDDMAGTQQVRMVYKFDPPTYEFVQPPLPLDPPAPKGPQNAERQSEGSAEERAPSADAGAAEENSGSDRG